MKTQTQHTPTPWRVSAAGNIRRDDGTTAGKVIASPQSEHDAAFIVQACNSHASLVARVAELEGALARLLSLAEHRLPPQWQAGPNETGHPLKTARALLSKGGAQ